jgi:IclR family transcriptional regulator, pca regulon regulatory protein
VSERPEIDRRYFVETAARTLELLHVVAETDAPASLGVLVSRLGWSKPAVYRLVRTLEAVGALRQQDERGYVLGPSLITLGQGALRATRVAEIVRPHLERLAEDVGETVVLTVLDGTDIIYIDRIESDQILIPRTQVGSRLPAYCTSTGQVLLAALDDDEVRRRLPGREFTPMTGRTLRTVDALIARLAEVRRRGYALNDEELAVGHRAVAAAVSNHHDEVAAAMSVSVPAARVSLDRLEEFAMNSLIPRCAEASVALGAGRALAV